MYWIQNLTRAIHFIENNLTNEITVEDVSNHAHSSSSNFQRVFNLVTGMTIGDYIRNRRLSMAGQELLHQKRRIIDVAMRYQYDTQESFSKAFTRFHGISPSLVGKLGFSIRKIKIFNPITINVTIQGGFDMSRKLINNVPIHQLQYPEQGQNYVFNGCMKFLMECMGEDEQYDYWFFSMVSGDSFVQVFRADKTRANACFSDTSKFDYELIKRVFDSIGYNFTYISAEEWQKDKQKCKLKLMEYIDKGIPVIGKGFNYTDESGNELPTDEVSCIIGYENDGECFYRLPEEATNLIPFTLDDPIPYIFVFIEEKKTALPIAEVYKNALLNAPKLMQTPPDGNIFFGNDAFNKWAEMLEGDFYVMKPEEFEKGFGIWQRYTIYICIIATNIFHKKDTIDRAIKMNSDLAHLTPLLDKEYKELNDLENKLREAEGEFNVTYEVLQDSAKRKKIAGILRQFPNVYSRIMEIINSCE